MEAVLAVLWLHGVWGCPRLSRVAKSAAHQITPDLRHFRQQQTQRLSGFASRQASPACEGDCQFPLMLPDSATQRPEVPFWGELSKQWKGASVPWDCSSVPSRLQQPHSTAAASHIPQVPAYKARNSL